MWPFSQKISAMYLFRLCACSRQIELFEQHYPDGLRLPRWGAKRQKVLDEAAAKGLDVDWFLRHTKQSGVAKEFRHGSLYKAVGIKKGFYHGWGIYFNSDGTVYTVREFHDGLIVWVPPLPSGLRR